MVMASEVGVYDSDPGDVVQKGRLMPGRMLLVDTLEKTITQDEALKKSISESRPHGQWWKNHVTLEDLRKNNKVNIDTTRKPIIRTCSEDRGENFTVWKFHDFSITHILREINFGEFRSAK